MPDSPLLGQAAIVTGASQGLGRAIALRLASLGARVALAARNPTRLAQVASALAAVGPAPLSIPTDVREPEAVEALVRTTLQAFGQLDVLVNNAGIGHFAAPLHETTPAVWAATMETNLRSVYLAIRAAAPHMIQRRCGHIINIASLAAHNPLKNGAVYAASKAALHHLSVSTAEELRDHGIRVSLICPGSVDTDLSPDLVGKKDRQKMLRPDDVAHVVAMLVTQGPTSFVSEVQMRPTQKP